MVAGSPSWKKRDSVCAARKRSSASVQVKVCRLWPLPLMGDGLAIRTRASRQGWLLTGLLAAGTSGRIAARS